MGRLFGQQKGSLLWHFSDRFFRAYQHSPYTLPYLLTVVEYRQTIQFKKLHRLLGTVYVFGTLFISAPCGLILAFYAFGGTLSKVSFISLSVLWFVFTYKAWIKAKHHDFNAHKRYMERSFILLFSAIVLRLHCVAFERIFGWAGMETYTFISITSWVVPLLAYELKLQLRAKPSNKKFSH